MAGASRLSCEKKYVGDGRLLDACRSLLDWACVPDPTFPEGEIHSVYFDSPALEAYAEKDNGDRLKRKVRIRWYGGAGKTAFIEVKSRIGAARTKERKRVEADERWLARAPLTDGKWIDLLAGGTRGMESGAPTHWVPMACISYLRRRYLCPRTGARVALDARIRAERFNGDVLPFARAARLECVVCEIKDTDSEASPLAEELHRAGFRLRSFSKYGGCIDHALQGGAPA